MSDRILLEERLVSAALIGTGKQPPCPLESGHPVDQILSGSQALSPEQQLLLQAGARGVYRLAGTRPVAVPALPPAPPEEGIPASPRIVEILQAAFSSQSLPLLGEFLDLLQARHIQFPARLLPLALNVQDAGRRRQLQQVLGSRACWLAAFRREWNWLIRDESSSPDPGEWTRIFEEGAFTERLEALKQFRRYDAAAARELLQTTIGVEKGDQKRKLLECLHEGLSVDDEPFLEGFQADRGKKIRQLVCGMLARLPGSRLAQRNCARVADGFQWSTSETGKPQFEIQLPAELPEDWKRDGLDESPPSGMSSRSALLWELVRRTPPDFWTVHFQKTPEDLISATELHEEGSLMRSAWMEALHALPTPSPERDLWEKSLWGAAVRQRRLGRIPLPELIAHLQRLAEVISPPQLDDCLTRLLQEYPEVTLLPMEDWLARVAVPWTSDLSRAWLHITREVFRKQSDIGTAEWSSTLLRAALGLAPGCFDEALQPWSLNSSGSAPWIASQIEALLRQFGEVIRLRQEFHQEIQRSLASFQEEAVSDRRPG